MGNGKHLNTQRLAAVVKITMCRLAAVEDTIIEKPLRKPFLGFLGLEYLRCHHCFLYRNRNTTMHNSPSRSSATTEHDCWIPAVPLLWRRQPQQLSHLHEEAGEQGSLDVQGVAATSEGRHGDGKLCPPQDVDELVPEAVGAAQGGEAQVVGLTPLLYPAVWAGGKPKYFIDPMHSTTGGPSGHWADGLLSCAVLFVR